MWTRDTLLEKTTSVLDEQGYTHCPSLGCVDIVAKKERVVLLKVLVNVDAFQQEQSNNLSIISDNLGAEPLVVGAHTRQGRLQGNIIYERFGTPVVTVETLQAILYDELPTVFRKRGGLYATVSAALLRHARLQRGLSQSELAQRIGVSKKNVYEHEARDRPVLYIVAGRMEDELSATVTVPASLAGFHQQPRKNLAQNAVERHVVSSLQRLGFTVDVVEKASFNLMARTVGKPLIIAAETGRQVIDTEPLAAFSSVVGAPAVLVGTPASEPTVRDDLPYIPLKELRHYRTSRQLLRRVKQG